MIMNKTDILLEKYLGSVKEKWKRNEEITEVFINPDSKEMREITGKSNWGEFAAIIPNDKDFIVFSRNTLHQSVIDQLKIKGDIITVSCYIDKKEIDMMITDATRHSKWFHNPDIADYIESNKYLSRKFNSFTYSFYDEPIFGDWRDTDDD